MHICSIWVQGSMPESCPSHCLCPVRAQLSSAWPNPGEEAQGRGGTSGGGPRPSGHADPPPGDTGQGHPKVSCSPKPAVSRGRWGDPKLPSHGPWRAAMSPRSALSLALLCGPSPAGDASWGQTPRSQVCEDKEQGEEPEPTLSLLQLPLQGPRGDSL